MKIALISLSCWLGYLLLGYFIIKQMLKDGGFAVVIDNTNLPDSLKSSLRVYATISSVCSLLSTTLYLLPEQCVVTPYIPFLMAFFAGLSGIFSSYSKYREGTKWKQQQS